MKIDKNNILTESGKAVKFWRKIKLLDQKSLSDMLGCSRSYVAKLENGHVGMSFSKIIIIADLLDVNYLSLLHYPDEKAVEILKDIYDDLEINVSKHELEILWHQSVFLGSDSTFKNYKKLLDVLRGESSKKSETPRVVVRDDEPKEKAYYLKRMGKKANTRKINQRI